jgi:hypothetical protein
LRVPSGCCLLVLVDGEPRSACALFRTQAPVLSGGSTYAVVDISFVYAQIASLTTFASLSGQMAAAIQSALRNRPAEGPEDPMGVRTVPIIAPTILTSAPSPGEPMDITTPTNSSAPASATKSPGTEIKLNGGPSERPLLHSEHTSAESIIMPAPAAAAPAVHQPKIVQTAFIHKLYKCASSPIIHSHNGR